MVEMTRAERAQKIDRIVTEAFALLGTGRQVAPFSSRYPDFGLPEAYDVAMRICDLRRGGWNVLGSPLKALRFLVEELTRYPNCESLRPGELVTTGTLTEAMPAISGHNWATNLAGIGIDGLRLRLR